jgi:hypothetical protein
LGAQVVRIIADVLHVHFTPSASESGIGGGDPIGALLRRRVPQHRVIPFHCRPSFFGAQISGVFSIPCLMEKQISVVVSTVFADIGNGCVQRA